MKEKEYAINEVEKESKKFDVILCQHIRKIMDLSILIVKSKKKWKKKSML